MSGLHYRVVWIHALMRFPIRPTWFMRIHLRYINQVTSSALLKFCTFTKNNKSDCFKQSFKINEKILINQHIKLNASRQVIDF
jgi:hypothetical protein